MPKKTTVPAGIIRRAIDGVRYIATGNADWFGPAEPLPPVAPQAEGRRWDYQSHINQTVNTPKALSGDGIGFGSLRLLASSHDILRSVIETRKDQMERLTWSIVDRVPGKKPSNEADKASQFFQFPDKYNNWHGWLRMLLEDLFVIDAPTIYVRKTLGGDLYSLEVIDGATIKPIIDSTGRTPMSPDPAYQQILHGMAAVNYTRDELLYRPRNIRSHSVYGYSPVEQIVMTINIALRRQFFQLAYYTEGSIPDAIVGLPDSWSPEEIKEFQLAFDTLMSGDSAKRRKMTFLPTDVVSGYKETKQPPMKDMYDEWLARVICYAFSIEPTPFISQTNRAVADAAQRQSGLDGILPIKNWVKGLIDGILSNQMGMPGLQFQWNEEKPVSPLDQATINKSYVDAGILTVNEVREGLGLEPLSEDQINPPVAAQTPPKNDGEKIAKVDASIKPIDHDRSLVLDSEKEMVAIVAKFFKSQVLPISEQIVSIISLEKSDKLEQLQLDWSELPELVVGLMTDVAIDGGKLALEQIGVFDDSVLKSLRKKAISFAQDRSAEMVGMKYVDGGLVTSPNAKWAITDSTREMLRGLTNKALTEGWSADQLASEIEASYSMSESRALMIARTELAIADSEGSMIGYRESGIVKGKRWITANDDRVSPPCVLNGEAGEVVLDGKFPSGASAPPGHPRCRCAVIPVLTD